MNLTPANEPVAYLAVIKAAIALAVVFGLSLPVGWDIAVLVFAEAVFTAWQRSKVTPV